MFLFVLPKQSWQVGRANCRCGLGETGGQGLVGEMGRWAFVDEMGGRGLVCEIGGRGVVGEPMGGASSGKLEGAVLSGSRGYKLFCNNQKRAVWFPKSC